MIAEYYYNQAGLSAREWDDERDRYRLLTKVEPLQGMALCDLGEIEKTRGNPDAAVGCWKNSVAINERLKLNAREAEQAAERLKVFAD